MWIDELNDLALLPRAQQYSALRQLRKTFTESDEQWNTAFGPTSLYEAWTQLPVMQGLYQRSRAVIQETLQGRSRLAHRRDRWRQRSAMAGTSQSTTGRHADVDRPSR